MKHLWGREGVTGSLGEASENGLLLPKEILEMKRYFIPIVQEQEKSLNLSLWVSCEAPRVNMQQPFSGSVPASGSG